MERRGGARSLCALARVDFALGVCLCAPQRERRSRPFPDWLCRRQQSRRAEGNREKGKKEESENSES